MAGHTEMKVLKIVAIVIGAAALILTGIGVVAGASIVSSFGAVAATVGSALGVSGGLVAGVALAGLAIGGLTLLEGIFPKPSQGGSQTKWKADPYAGIPYVMGRTLVGGNIVYRRGHGTNNVYETFVTILSLGAIASIDTTFMNKTTVAFDGAGNATGTYRNQIYQRTQIGNAPTVSALSPPIGTPPGWTGAHKLSGLAASMNTFCYDSKSDTGLTSEPAPSWIIHGVKVYDPRLDSTYPGGSGACRALDESTYVWSEDPHLHALTWALGRWQNGKRVAGIGAPVASIDVPRFVEGANLNDARGWTIGGQVYTRPDTPWNSMKAMLQAGGAQAIIVGGRISCVNRAPRVSLATITRDDIVGDSSFSGTQPRRSRINGIIPSYRSEAHDWEMVPARIVQVPAFVALDGDERTKDVPYPLVQNVNQVAQLAAYDICDAREAGPGSTQLKPWWLNYTIGDCVTFAPEDGLSLKVLLTSRELNPQTGIVTYSMKTETDGKHPFALGLTGTPPATAGITYSADVAAPGGGDWSVAGDTFSDNGVSIPAIVVAGACGNPNADAVIFELRVHGVTDWTTIATDPPNTTRREISGLTPGTSYDVAARYRVRGVIGPRTVYGPAIAGQFSFETAVNNYNRVRFSDMERGTYSYTSGAANGAVPASFGQYAIPPGTGSGFDGIPYLETGATITSAMTDPYTAIYKSVAVQPSTRVALQAYAGGYPDGDATVPRCDFNIAFQDNAGAAVAPDLNLASGTISTDLFANHRQFFVDIPAGCTRCIIYVAVFGSISAGSGGIHAQLSRPMISDAAPGQTNFPPYSAGVADGIDGHDGAPGRSNAPVYAYQRSASGAPAGPTAATTYTFATATLTGLDNGWSAIQPAGDDPLYVIVATASSPTATDTIAATEWSGAVLLGSAGLDGLNSAPVFIYQRATSDPALPDATATYTFATKALTGLDNGWSPTIPAGSDPIYVSTATAASIGVSDTIAATEWAAVSILARNGDPGTAGISAALTKPAIQLAAFADGTLTSDALTDANGNFTLRQGSTDLSSSAAYSVVSATSGLSITIDAATGAYAVTGLAVDAGAAVLRAAYSSVNYDLTLSVNKTKQGSAAFSVRSAASGTVSSTSYSTVPAQVLNMATSPGAGIQITCTMLYTATSLNPTMTAKLQYAINGGTWTDTSPSSEATGNPAGTAGGVAGPDVGDIYLSGTVPSSAFASGDVVSTRVIARKTTSPGSALTISNGRLTTSWADV